MNLENLETYFERNPLSSKLLKKGVYMKCLLLTATLFLTTFASAQETQKAKNYVPDENHLAPQSRRMMQAQEATTTDDHLVRAKKKKDKERKKD